MSSNWLHPQAAVHVKQREEILRVRKGTAVAEIARNKTKA
jgi:hypothetical protein